jgi:hypothetical protein
MPSSATLPTPMTLLPYSSYVDLLSPPPHARGASKHSCKLICGVKTTETHDNTMMKVPMPVSSMVTGAAVVAVQVFGGHIGQWALANEW